MSEPSVATPPSPPSLEAFIAKWAASGASERANKDQFLVELCDELGVPRPDPTTGDREADSYVFEKDAPLLGEGGASSVGKIDLYKRGAFILEAKQGSEAGAQKLGTAKRRTPGWHLSMKDAYGQAYGYAQRFDEPPPFLVVVDIGYCFDLYAAFDGSYDYRPFPDAQASRLYLKDLAQHRETLRRVFLDPLSLDPSKRAAKVTREVAEHLARLAKKLDEDGHPQELTAKFLMRCLFTMFAEDVGLLPARLFTDAIEKHWLPAPASFPAGIESLWATMNEGGTMFTVGRILRFNGGLFAESAALPLDKTALGYLLDAAKCDWSGVEPAIFGTLLERALDKRERHQLGAHYTPRSYVERLVRPTIEQPLRAEWELCQAEVRLLTVAAESAKTEKVKKAKLKEALGLVHAYHERLCQTRVLDPACGTGNFLYVTLDLFKRLESEVFALLESLGDTQSRLHLETIRVSPAQFLGIEVKPWAKEIAELVLWIGYLQWHFRAFGRAIPVPEPVLQDYQNIQCRDAVLEWDSVELARDDKGKPLSRWDGVTMKTSPVTGKPIPDEAAQVPVYRYVNPRRAKWPRADYIIGNPPFVGAGPLRATLGSGYVEALRSTYAELPESVDFVMYWWHKAAERVATGKVKRAGLITTNSITQTFNRRVVERHTSPAGGERAVDLVFAIPDHPWVEASDGAAVRIGMSVMRRREGEPSPGVLAKVAREDEVESDSYVVELSERQGVVLPDFTIGANVTSAIDLKANANLSNPGVKLHGAGFIVTPEEARALGLGEERGLDRHIRPYLNGRDLTQTSRRVMVIDLYGLTAEAARARHPRTYQRVFDRVKPERDAKASSSKDSAAYAAAWWLFGKTRPQLRLILKGLPRFVATVETAKHRVFVFLDQSILPDNKLVNIASADALHLGVLSSRVHVTWALAAGSTLEDRPVYVKTTCFEKFPFPLPTKPQAARIRALGEQLDAHRKRQQAAHPGLTITGMYNVLEKLRAGEALTAKEKLIHEQGLVSVLRQIHDELDQAVFEAYGWPKALTDEEILERLVALNAERAAEEAGGLVRWLRPEFQRQTGAHAMEQTDLAIAAAPSEPPPRPSQAPPSARTLTWPKKVPAQLAALRELLQGNKRTAWTTADVAQAFKGAKRGEVTEALESLAALGLVTGEGGRWRAGR